LRAMLQRDRWPTGVSLLLRQLTRYLQSLAYCSLYVILKCLVKRPTLLDSGLSN
jgi:hypothetical protein